MIWLFELFDYLGGAGGFPLPAIFLEIHIFVTVHVYGLMACTTPLWKEGVKSLKMTNMSIINRLSENAKFKKSDVDIKGLMTREFAKIPILGQPVKI